LRKTRNLLLITCSAGKEEKAEIEILDCLLRYDETAEVYKTEFPGVLLADTKLPLSKAVSYLKRFEMAYVHRITPLSKTVEASTDVIIEAALQLVRSELKTGSSFAVRCVKRGNRIKSKREIEKKIGEVIVRELKARVNLSNPEYILHVEVLGDFAGIYLEHLK